MINNLPYELLCEIFYYLPNEDIIENLLINKKIYELTKSDIFMENIMYRDHPMVFNKLGNYCNKCNLNIFIVCEDNFRTMICKHM